MMTWWEVEQMTLYVGEVERDLDEWSLTNPKMRLEQRTVSKLARTIKNNLPTAEDPDKRDFLAHLAARIDDLQEDLTERLKRDVSPRISL